MSHRSRSLNPVWESVFYPDEPSEDESDARIYLPTRKFCSGSEYTGQWRKIEMDGDGVFTFPHGVVYTGQLRDGKFHGEGILKYPQGQQFEGTWKNGRLIRYKFRFSDGLYHDSPWKYCKYPDRRFYITIENGFNGTPEEYRTNAPVAREIPPGMYDTVDGFYDPALKCVVSANDLKKVLRILTFAEEKWTLENCRKAWDENVGFRPELYEKWTTGDFTEMDISDETQVSSSEIIEESETSSDLL